MARRPAARRPERGLDSPADDPRARELAELIRRSGLSTEAFAGRLELGVRTVQRCLSGHQPVPLVTVLAARWLVEHGL